MKGSIGLDQATCACGGKFRKVQIKNRDYWECESCEKEPTLYRVRRYLPGLMRSGMTEIRYDNTGKRIRDIDTARAVMKQIDAELITGTFDPSKYRLRDSDNLLRFENFITKKYLPYYEARLDAGEVKPSTMKAKRQYLRNYLIPLLEGTSIKDIKAGVIRDLQVRMKCSIMMKKKVIEELKVIMFYAKDIAEVIEVVPGFPSFPKSKLMDAGKFLTYEEQKKVLSCISNEQYRIMISLLVHFALRPSEVRALKWSDIDYKNMHIKIQRHVTMNCIVVPGRKSLDGEVHRVPITPVFSKIMEPLPRPLNQDTYIFPGNVTEIVPENRLRKTWSAAIKKAGLPHVDLYRGTKSSTLTQLRRNGATRDEIRQLSGHKNVDQVDAYAQLTDKDMTFRNFNLLMAREEE